MAEDFNPLHRDIEEQEEPEAPRSLREIAKTLDHPRRETLERSRRYEDETEQGDRILKPDEQGYRPEIEPPRYKSEQDLYAAREGERAEADAQQVEDEKARHDQFEESWRADNQYIGGWNAPEEHQALNAYTQRYQTWQAGVARQQQIEARGALEVQRLNASGQHAAAMIVAKQILAGREPLQQEEAVLTAGAQKAAHHQAEKSKAVNRREMLRVAPELAHADVRRAFKSWLIKECGVPPSDVEREQSAQVVGQYFREYLKYESANYDRLARRKIATEVRASRGPGSETSSADARKTLKERGSPDAALNYLNLRRLERRYGV